MQTTPQNSRFKVSPVEADYINQAILALNRAKQAPTESHFVEAVKSAYLTSRIVVRGRLD